MALNSAGAAGTGEWTSRILELAPALRGCLGAVGSAAAFATEAEQAPPPGGPVRVRVWRAPGGEALECGVAADGSGAVLRPIPGAPAADAAAPAFFLERRCVDARRVDAPDGAVLGWLAYPAC